MATEESRVHELQDERTGLETLLAANKSLTTVMQKQEEARYSLIIFYDLNPATVYVRPS